MKIYSVEIGKEIRKGITVSLKEKLKFISFDKKASKLQVSIFFPDIIYSTISLPKVDDEETLQILIRSRMSPLLEEEKDYSFVTIKKEDISENESLYDVYGIPADKFFEIMDILNENPDNVELFTCNIFSLIPVSKKLSKDQVCFHFYGDKEKVLITVSKGENLLYARSIPLPDFIEPSDLTNIYYENFNMTYVFAVQNKRINVETIIISGNASSDKELLDLCRNLTNLEIKIPSADSFITGISQEDFMEYLIPIGTALLSKNFDFSPYMVKKEKIFKKITKILSLFSVLFLVLVTLGVFSVYTDISEKERIFLNLKSSIQKKIHSIDKKISREKIDYFTNYIKILEKSDSLNPVFVFDQMPTLFEVLSEKSITIENKDKIQIIQILSEEHFVSLSQMLNFKMKLNEILSRYKNVYKNIQENKEDLSLKINLRIERYLDENK